MSLLTNIVGFSLFGLAARFGQLGIQRRNMLSNPTAHLISMGVFGYVGYWAYKWEIISAELIAAKREEIIERRRQLVSQIEESE
ncbi:hypothetical protein BDQ17DRAFT_1245359 [Cyathus striatus]|nr:hypothetical protein BDQ17DRAFT_1245359 [Cyathus striatus]